MSKWLAHDLLILQREYARGLPHKLIARKVGRSRSATEAKARRLGLSNRRGIRSTSSLCLTIEVTEAEHETLRLRADGVPFAKYIRQVLFGEPNV